MRESNEQKFSGIPRRIVSGCAVGFVVVISCCSAAWADTATLPAPNQYNSTPGDAIAAAAAFDPQPYSSYGSEWTVPQDNSNPFDTGAWGQCTYWAIEKRPDLADDMTEPGAWTTAPVAANNGYVVNNIPQVGDIAVWPAGYAGAGAVTGHVAYVEQVLADGGIVVSEMNGGFGSELDTRYIPQPEVVGPDPAATFTANLPATPNWSASSYSFPNSDQIYFVHQQFTKSTPTSRSSTTPTSSSSTTPTSSSSTTPTSSSSTTPTVKLKQAHASVTVKHFGATVMVRLTGLRGVVRVDVTATRRPHGSDRAAFPKRLHKGRTTAAIAFRLPQLANTRWTLRVVFRTATGYRGLKTRTLVVTTR